MTGKTIARYEIQSEIGRGGMATVYLAYDPNFRRKVAIKLVSINFQENPVFRERFEREAHLIAKIEHPAIVPVYDFGEQGDQLYLVMRYMPGGSLTQKIREGQATLAYVTQILSQIAPALDAVHAHGIVHRDLKPANILLDNFGNAAISDFGIAHFTAATTDLTGSAIIGTPAYMSPEQVRGEPDLDGRSDIYALGVILFEMLTGRGPYQASTPMSVALKHLTEPVPPIRAYRPDLPQEIEHILNTALEKERDMRYASATDLVQALKMIANTLRPNEMPAPQPVNLARSEDLPTEVDAEKPGPVFESSASPRMIAPPIPAASTDKPSGSGVPPRRTSRTILPIAAVAIVGLSLLFLCGSAGLLGTWAGLGLPGLFSRGSKTPTSPTSASTSIPETILFSDDFSDPDSGWPVLQNARGGYAYQEDGYHIFVHEMDAVLWATTDRQDADASLAVEARPVSKGSNSYYGLLCRIQDDQNFYYFVVRASGDFTIGKYKHGEFQSLFPEGWRQSDAVNQGKQTNRLKAECSGDTLRMYANDVFLGEANDPDFTSGLSGILVGALEPKGFETVFNDFVITKPAR